MSDKPQDLEVELLLGLYKERYEQARTIEQLRATYFNIYIVIMGAALAALADALSRVALTDLGSIGAIVGGAMWGMSLLTIMRAERFGGHISHNLKGVSRIRKQLAIKYPVVQAVLPDSTRRDGLDFRRPPWSRNKSIETLAGIVGAGAGSLLVALSLVNLDFVPLTIIAAGLLIGYGVFGFLELTRPRLTRARRVAVLVITLALCLLAAFLVRDLALARVVIGISGLLTGFAVWVAEVANLEARHQGCCLNIEGKPASVPAALANVSPDIADPTRKSGTREKTKPANPTP